MPDRKTSTVKAPRWFTLNETLEHIRRVQSCPSIEAQRKLKAKVGEGTIPVKWADPEGVDDLPNPQYLQGIKLILSETGLAHDKDSDVYRPLMVLRSAIMTAWQRSKL